MYEFNGLFSIIQVLCFTAIPIDLDKGVNVSE